MGKGREQWQGTKSEALSNGLVLGWSAGVALSVKTCQAFQVFCQEKCGRENNVSLLVSQVEGSLIDQRLAP